MILSRSPILPVVVVSALGLVLGFAPRLQRARMASSARERIAGVARRLPDAMVSPPVTPGQASASAGLASWQSIGGCGAGAGGGSGVGIKWIGRNVRGGLVHLELQGNYVQTPYGHDYVAMTLLSGELSDRWTIGVSVPYLYKYMNDPYGLNVDVANKGPGDISLMLTRRFGAINDTSVMLSVGAPTGTHTAKFRDSEVLAQERQLGLGKPTASLTIDHTMDALWGLGLIGATAAYRGGENAATRNYRAATASAYGYVCTLLGPFAPAIGVSASGWQGYDRDQGNKQLTPLFNVAGNLSIEYATDVAAVLIGASLPYQYDGTPSDQNGARNPWGLGSLVVGVGLAFAPF